MILPASVNNPMEIIWARISYLNPRHIYPYFFGYTLEYISLTHLPRQGPNKEISYTNERELSHWDKDYFVLATTTTALVNNTYVECPNSFYYAKGFSTEDYCLSGDPVLVPLNKGEKQIEGKIDPFNIQL